MHYVQVQNGVVIQKRYQAPVEDDQRQWIEADASVVVGFTYDGSSFAAPPPQPITASEIKREAERRILLIAAEWQQRNMNAEDARLSEKGRVNWSPEDLSAWDANQTRWAEIDAIRTMSNVIEAMEPIPLDYTNDAYWTV